MSSSAHAVALRRQHAQQSRLKWTVLVPLALAGSITAAHGQANPTRARNAAWRTAHGAGRDTAWPSR